MMDPLSLLHAMDGIDAVITTTAGYTRHSAADTAEIDTIGNRNLVDAASQTGIRRFVLTSILTCEETPQVPHSWHKKLTEDRKIRARTIPGGILSGASVVAGRFNPMIKDMAAMMRWFQTGRYIIDPTRQREAFGEVPTVERPSRHS
jgi:uncharacterized protein YbjT (DUF2867 family)